MKMLKRLVICYLLLLVPSLATAKIVFTSNRGGGSSIYVMNDDGSNVQRLTFAKIPGMPEDAPTWSPDGKHITFLRITAKGGPAQSQQANLFLINQDGSNEQQLTNHPSLNTSHTWAPDGHRIAFTSNRNGRLDLYVIDILTQELQQLTHNKEVRSWAAGPSWSPNGKYIAYRQALPPRGLTTIYVMRSNGTAPHPVVPGDDWYRYAPCWSHDSKSVLYCESLYKEQVPGQGARLVSSRVVIQQHGAKARRFLKTPKKWLIHSACWMNNGKQVLIAADEYGAPDRQIDIYRYHLANDTLTNLTNHPQGDSAPNWISDVVLSVTPSAEKKLTQWGTVKQ